MTSEKWLTGPASIEDLKHFKKLEPLTDKARDELTRIERLDTNGMNEADVREAIIAPLIRLLGYDDSTTFSPKRELHLDYLGSPLRADYALRFWKENFWIIEAKKPQSGKFSQENLLQGLQYAAHPLVNASLIVLCDGEAIEIFDREESLSKPMLRVERVNLTSNIDELRSVLSPWQVWFFQKRRIAKLIDKVFDKEFNSSRVDEFRDLVERRLDSKSIKITQNFQTLMKGRGEDKEVTDDLSRADFADLVDGCLHLNLSTFHLETITDSLVRQCNPNSFRVLYKIFPDNPRAANDLYYGHALLFLMKLHRSKARVSWMPAFLGQGQSMSAEEATRRLIGYCLTYFKNDEGRRCVLLYAAAARRILKFLFVTHGRDIGNIQHAVDRFSAPELSARQFTSSPEYHMVVGLDGLTAYQTQQFIRDCQTQRDKFDINLARMKLKEIWRLECRLVAAIPEALPLMRSLGELPSCEFVSTVYDQLGHSALCMLNQFPEWKAYTLQHHWSEVETIGRSGSWQARDWLSDDGPIPRTRLDKAETAERFFLGDMQIMQEVQSIYDLSAN